MPPSSDSPLPASRPERQPPATAPPPVGAFRRGPRAGRSVTANGRSRGSLGRDRSRASPRRLRVRRLGDRQVRDDLLEGALVRRVVGEPGMDRLGQRAKTARRARARDRRRPGSDRRARSGRRTARPRRAISASTSPDGRRQTSPRAGTGRGPSRAGARRRSPPSHGAPGACASRGGNGTRTTTALVGFGRRSPRQGTLGRCRRRRPRSAHPRAHRSPWQGPPRRARRPLAR